MRPMSIKPAAPNQASRRATCGRNRPHRNRRCLHRPAHPASTLARWSASRTDPRLRPAQSRFLPARARSCSRLSADRPHSRSERPLSRRARPHRRRSPPRPARRLRSTRLPRRRPASRLARPRRQPLQRLAPLSRRFVRRPVPRRGRSQPALVLPRRHRCRAGRRLPHCGATRRRRPPPSGRSMPPTCRTPPRFSRTNRQCRARRKLPNPCRWPHRHHNRLPLQPFFPPHRRFRSPSRLSRRSNPGRPLCRQRWTPSSRSRRRWRSCLAVRAISPTRAEPVARRHHRGGGIQSCQCWPMARMTNHTITQSAIRPR